MTDSSRYLDHLPAVLQDDPFIGQFLRAFERILSGLPVDDAPSLPSVAPGLEQLLSRIHTFFDPTLAPPEFLPWLASWVATSLRDDWDTATRRRFLANVVPLYLRRGTKRALQQLLELYLNPDASAQQANQENIQIVDSDPTAPPRYFQVQFTVVEHDPQVLIKRAAIATAIIDREKPAHTFYGLHINYPSLQISDDPAKGVIVGINTVLGGNVVTPANI